MALSARSLLLIIVFSVAHANEFEGPQNTVAIIDSQVNLTCVSQSGNCNNVDWSKTSLDANPQTVYRKEILSYYRDRYSVDNSTGCHLVIKKVQLADAGRFTCRVDSVRNLDAHLVVLAAEPRCETDASPHDTVEGDAVNSTCEVTYGGTDRASMTWKDVAGAPAVVENGKTMTLTYSVDASAPEIPSFTCVVTFEVIMAINGATNIPTTTCHTPSIKILYPVRNVTLSPSLTNYVPGTSITCTAKGNPSPRFRWQLLVETENEDNGTWSDILNETRSELVIHDTNSNRYRCVAVNAIRNTIHEATSHTFQVNDTGAWSVLVILMAVGLSVGFVLLAVCLICYCGRKSKGSGPSAATSSCKRETDCAVGQGETGYLNMDSPNNSEISGYVDVDRPLSDNSYNSEFAT